ncbi:hypothetical protein [Ahrensia kielensis]|uniref:hypothetical protein n=1 Tax=Ahrensia kielensis TaxID=76980 RepID=UPI00036A6B21|nr:hypothetical protein [Ahrensia kielensis]
MKAVVFLGSVRESKPPHPARLGARVAAACASQLAKTDINVEIIDPLDLNLPAVFKPHFSFWRRMRT